MGGLPPQLTAFALGWGKRLNKYQAPPTDKFYCHHFCAVRHTNAENTMSLKSDIEKWDRKSAEDIGAVFECYKSDNSFIPTIIELTRIESCQNGATWLLKKAFESGVEIDQELCASVLKKYDELNSWESKLHLLQSLPYILIDTTSLNFVLAFLRECLVDSNKFVRAWAYNGFNEVSKQYPEYESETKQFFEMAMQDESASVKARIRNICKARKWHLTSI